MTYRPTAVERAFMLAASGRVSTVAEIKQALRVEGYPDEGQLSGPSIAKQLGKLIQDAKVKSRQGSQS